MGLCYAKPHFTAFYEIFCKNLFYLIEGWVFSNTNSSHDFIVTSEDERGIFNNIISENKTHYKVWGAHTAGWKEASLPARDITKSIIKDGVNKRALSNYNTYEVK